MSVPTQLWGKGGHRLTAHTVPAKSRRARLTMAQISEACWGILTFALCLALGPFSAIAVVFSLGSLARGQEGGMEPHAAR
jgi:hypothetical protein